MKVLGFDIGTTTICASVVDSQSGKVLDTATKANDSAIMAESWEKRQDPEIIMETVRDLVKTMSDKHGVEAIGVTGQMHGIVYLDENGKAVSNLFTWQDGRGDLDAGGQTYAQKLAQMSGSMLATGFGSVTHYYNVCNGLVPENAVVFCTIHDYAAMTLAGAMRPRVHVSDAASFGLFNAADGCFNTNVISKAGMAADMFPEVSAEYECLGKTEDGIPVFCAVGDNQASFIGSVRDMDGALLVNVGTGSQISFLCDGKPVGEALEIRPLVEGMYIAVGSSLCGGRAYALLEKFFREMATEAGFDCKSLYPVLDRMSAQFETLSNKLDISARFAGTRLDPSLRGSVNNIGIDNFTPQHFAVGVLEATVNELYDMAPGVKAVSLVGSGNGVRKGEVLRKMFSAQYDLPLQVPTHTEEAAYGAALYAMVGAGEYADIRSAQRIINFD